MIVVDTSAIVAVARSEPGSDPVASVLSTSVRVAMSPVNFVELRMVAARLDSLAAIEKMVRDIGIVIVPVDLAQTEVAWSAFLRFGKGRHKAALNLADCFAYALAQVSGAPLLYVGQDFARTDIRPALV